MFLSTRQAAQLLTALLFATKKKRPMAAFPSQIPRSNNMERI